VPLKSLAARHEVTAIALEDTRETALPRGGWITLAGAERGAPVLFDSGDPVARRQAERAIRSARAHRSAAFAAAGVREVVIRTDGEYLPALRAAFGRARHRK
jgi:hypothetical protein